MTTVRRTRPIPSPTALQAVLAGPVLSLLRIVAGFLFACHGAMTLFGALGGLPPEAGDIGVGDWPFWYAGLVEFFGGGLIMLGLFTRPVALLCSGAMAYGYFTVHQPMALWPIQNLGELAILNAWVFLLIAVLGPGPWSLGALLRRLRSL
jgi:putative oxidoreductase